MTRFVQRGYNEHVINAAINKSKTKESNYLIHLVDLKTTESPLCLSTTPSQEALRAILTNTEVDLNVTLLYSISLRFWQHWRDFRYRYWNYPCVCVHLVWYN